MSHSSRTTKKGFTLIELSLALAFLSVMLITIALLTIHIISTYQKGLAIKAVTATGRELIDDFSRSISAASSVNADVLCGNRYTSNSAAYNRCLSDSAHKFVYQQHEAVIDGVNTQNGKVPTSGLFCTGRYTYIYNTGYTNPYIPSNDTSRATYTGGNTYRATFNSNDVFRLLKVSDPSRALCVSQLTDSYEIKNDSSPAYQLSVSDSEELLSSSEDNLAIYSLEIFKPTQHRLTHHSFYSGTFILATVQGGVDITSTGDYCTDPPDNLNTDFAYCAINKFNFAMRATGENNQ